MRLAIVAALFVVACGARAQYTDPVFGFSITPPQGWQTSGALLREYADAVVGWSKKSSTATLVVTLRHEDAPPTDRSYQTAMDALMISMRSVANGQGAGVVELGRTITKLGSVRFATIDLRISGTNDTVIRHRVRLVLADGRLYLIDAGARETEFPKVEPDLQAALDSFQPKDPASQGPLSRLDVRILYYVLGAIAVVFVALLITTLVVTRKARRRTWSSR